MGSNHFANKMFRREDTPLGKIVVKPGHREIVPKAVDDLASSFGDKGLINPILLSSRLGSESRVLIAGRHRLEAARQSEWRTIPAFIFEFASEIDEKLCEITENLHRAELSVEEAAVQRAEYARLTAVKRGEIAEDVPVQQLVAVTRGGGRDGENAGGIRATARELGTSDTQLRRDIAIASIPENVRAEAREAGITTQAALLRVAAEPTPEKQVEVVAKIAAAKAAPKPKVKREAKAKNLNTAQKMTPSVTTQTKHFMASQADKVTDENARELPRRPVPTLPSEWVSAFTINEPVEVELDRSAPWKSLPPEPPTAAEIEAIAGWLAENLVDGAASVLPNVLAPMARIPVSVLIEALKPYGYEPIPIIPDARLTPAPLVEVAPAARVEVEVSAPESVDEDWNKLSADECAVAVGLVEVEPVAIEDVEVMLPVVAPSPAAPAFVTRAKTVASGKRNKRDKGRVLTAEERAVWARKNGIGVSPLAAAA